MTTKRRDPPSTVRDEVLREAGYKCANPTCRNILTLQLHHIVWVKDDGGNEPTNLIALCGHCHDLHTHGHIPESAIRHWKGILHALNHAFDRASMDLLLYLNQPGAENVWYTGDGLLRFAGLIAAGLVGIAQSQFSVGVRYGDSAPTSPPTTAVRVKLTEKGGLLVRALGNIVLDLDARHLPMKLRADLWKNGQLVSLRPLGVFIDGIAIRGFGIENLCLVGFRLAIDTDRKVLSLVPSGPGGKGQVVSWPDPVERLRRGVDAWADLHERLTIGR